MTRPPLRLLLLLAAAALGFTLFRPTAESSSVSAIGPDAEALLVVDGVDHEFVLDTCFVGDHSFVVAGHGNQAGSDYRVLASPSQIELAFGVTEETEAVANEDSWLSVDDAPTWTTTDGRLDVRTALAEMMGESTVQHGAELRVDCDVTS